MKKAIAIILCFALIFIFAGCKSDNSTTSDNTKSDISVACLKGPTGVGMAKLMSDNENKKTKNNYDFILASSADEISGKIVSGEINIASVPTNLAAKLNSKTEGKITMLAVNTLGVLSILEDGNSIKSVADLKGKTIYTTGEGSNPEFILRYVLSKNGIDSHKDVDIHFVANNDELIATLVSGTAKIAMVPEPAATSAIVKKGSLKKVLSLNDEWQKISNGDLMMGCVVALKSYVENHKDAVNNFLKEYENSINFANSNIKETATLCEKYQIIPSANIAEKCIKDCNLTFVSGEKAQALIEDYFKVLLDADKTSIGGKLPQDDFYYKEK